MPAAASSANATTTMRVLGRPVFQAKATLADSPVLDWDQVSIALEITALVEFHGRQLGSRAAVRMSDEAGLDHDKANLFAEELSTIEAVHPGQTITTECAPGRTLVIKSPGKNIEIKDLPTARAFCWLWFSPQGDADLRRGLGLR